MFKETTFKLVQSIQFAVYEYMHDKTCTDLALCFSVYQTLDCNLARFYNCKLFNYGTEVQFQEQITFNAQKGQRNQDAVDAWQNACPTHDAEPLCQHHRDTSCVCEHQFDMSTLLI